MFSRYGWNYLVRLDPLGAALFQSMTVPHLPGGGAPVDSGPKQVQVDRPGNHVEFVVEPVDGLVVRVCQTHVMVSCGRGTRIRITIFRSDADIQKLR